MATATLISGGIVTDDGQGNTLTWQLALDPNGSGHPLLQVFPPDKTPATILDCQQIGGDRASARFVSQAETTWVLTDPATGFITWAG